MFLLMLHLVAITVLVLVVAGVAFRMGVEKGERRMQQRLDWAKEDGAAGGEATQGGARREDA